MNYDQTCSELIKAINALDSLVSSAENLAKKQSLLDLRHDMETGFYSIVLVLLCYKLLVAMEIGPRAVW